MRKWLATMSVSLVCLSAFLIPAHLVKAADTLTIVGSIEWKEVYMTYYSGYTIGDWAYVVTVNVTSGGSPVSGASVIADVIGPNGEAYWLRDGTHMLYDTVEGRGMNESGWTSGPTYGGGAGDGIYANFLELDAPLAEGSLGFFADHAGTWRVRLTASKEGYDSASIELTVDIEKKTGNFGHNFNFIDLDTSTPEQDWVISASPGETLGARVIYDETNPCGGCCVFYIRAWGCSYEAWGNTYDVDSGCTSERTDVKVTWTYTVPSTPGVYTMTLADAFSYWWPFYGENVGFVGKIYVRTPSACAPPEGEDPLWLDVPIPDSCCWSDSANCIEKRNFPGTSRWDDCLLTRIEAESGEKVELWCIAGPTPCLLGAGLGQHYDFRYFFPSGENYTVGQCNYIQGSNLGRV